MSCGHFTRSHFTSILLFLILGFISEFSIAQDSLNTTSRDAINVIMESKEDSSANKQNVVIPKRFSLEDFKSQLKNEGDKLFLEIVATNKSGGQNNLINGVYSFVIEGESEKLNFTSGIAKKELEDQPVTLFIKHKDGDKELSHFSRYTQQSNAGFITQNVPLWLSILPPLLAILFALLFREVLASLFAGIWLGGVLLYGFSPISIVKGFLKAADTYVVSALADPDHVAVIVFSLLIGGMVAIISKNGGMKGVVNSLSKYATTAKSAQVVTWLLGVAIFFDDYANTLIVGNTARSLTDKHRVSREKLAYIVDSTAAPVAAVALITTWIGAELGYIGDAVGELGLTEGAYSIFLNSMAYAFYPIFTLGFILMLVLQQKDFGPMLKAERRARETGRLFVLEDDRDEKAAMEELAPIEGKPHSAFRAVIPVLTVIIVTIWGLISTGYSADVWSDGQLSFFGKLSATIGDADSYKALLWSSISGVIMAIMLTLVGGIMNLRATMESLLTGIKTMIPAMVILVLAWALAQVTKDLHTAEFLTSMLQGQIAPTLLPILTFVLAGLIAFSTGSSWSTMAILYPLILPASWAICLSAGVPMELQMAIFYNVVSSVLAGSVLGDHCSPISDTTILSSLASQCNHIDHVRTQLPYALTVALVSLAISYFSIIVGLPAIINYLIGFGILFLISTSLGKNINVKPIPAQETDPGLYDDSDLIA